MRISARYGLAVVALVALAGCGQDLNEAQDNEERLNASIAAASGWEWPLTVTDGFVVCHDGRQLTYRPVGVETEYSLNGLAKGAHKYEPIESIWKMSPDGTGNRVDIGPMIQAGNLFCKNT